MNLRSEIVALDKRHVWHPYTPMDRYIAEVDPLVIDRAAGSRLFDVDGKSYLDANSSWWVASLGHNHPRLVAALAKQASRLSHVSLAGITHEGAARLSEELVAVAPPGLTRVFYSDNGSTAVEVAIKLAVQYWQNTGQTKRKRFIALDGAFHGETIGATSLGGVEVFRRPYAGVLFECVHVPPPSADIGESYARAFAALERVITEGHDEIAALVVEPILQGAGGMRSYDPEYLRRARALCTEHDVLLAVDEVFTGYGRTGPMWASDLAGITPDLLCLAKGFSGGMFPMAATLATPKIFDAFLGDPARAFYYGHTYCGNPLGAAVAREVLAIYRDEDILAKAEIKGKRISAAFHALAEIDGVTHPRSIGMTGAVDLTGSTDYLGRVGWRVYEEARKRGAYLRPLGDIVYVAPPLNIPDADLDELLTIVRESIVAALA